MSAGSCESHRLAALAAALVLVAACGAGKSGESANPAPAAGASAAPEVTPVTGPSQLHRLGLSLDETKLGHNGGTDPASRTWRAPRWTRSSTI